MRPPRERNGTLHVLGGDLHASRRPARLRPAAVRSPARLAGVGMEMGGRGTIGVHARRGPRGCSVLVTGGRRHQLRRPGNDSQPIRIRIEMTAASIRFTLIHRPLLDLLTKREVTGPGRRPNRPTDGSEADASPREASRVPHRAPQWASQAK